MSEPITNYDIEHIIDTLPELSPERVREVAAFVDFLAERQRKHKVFVDETLAAIAEPDAIVCNTAEEVMEAIMNWTE
ncbi:MAG: hypothetical protein HQK99_10230 [Nitrospirae bacterium]|nr:hypothetical protein [Nitrospirota bacterium]